MMGKLRRFIKAAAQAGGVPPGTSKSIYKPGSHDIRVDFEVHAGMACVPDLDNGGHRDE